MSLYKESEGGRLIFNSCNLIEYYKPGCLTYRDYNNINDCVKVYDKHLAKHNNKKLSKFDKMTKDRVKEYLNKLLTIGTDKEEKYKILSSVIYILTNFKETKEKEEEILNNKYY